MGKSVVNCYFQELYVKLPEDNQFPNAGGVTSKFTRVTRRKTMSPPDTSLAKKTRDPVVIISRRDPIGGGMIQ